MLTTAGDDPDRHSIGWEIHERAVAIRDARQLRRILAEGGDPRQVLSLRRAEEDDLPRAQAALLERDESNWLPVLYGLTAMFGDDPDDLDRVDIWDEALWYRCNPSLGKHLTLRALRLEAQAAKKSPAAEKLFRWLRLNQWISVKAVGWLPLTLYDKTQWNRPEWKVLSAPERRATVREYLRGKKCYGGLDLSTTTDLTALALLFPPQAGLESWVVLFWAWRPEDGTLEAEQRDHVPYRDWARAGFLELCPGDMVDFSMVEETVAAVAEEFQLDTLGVDPYLSRTLTPRLMERHIPVIEVPQDMKNLSPAMKEAERLIRAHQMLHEHNTAARWCERESRCTQDWQSRRCTGGYSTHRFRPRRCSHWWCPSSQNIAARRRTQLPAVPRWKQAARRFAPAQPPLCSRRGPAGAPPPTRRKQAGASGKTSFRALRAASLLPLSYPPRVSKVFPPCKNTEFPAQHSPGQRSCGSCCSIAVQMIPHWLQSPGHASNTALSMSSMGV